MIIHTTAIERGPPVRTRTVTGAARPFLPPHRGCPPLPPAPPRLPARPFLPPHRGCPPLPPAPPRLPAPSSRPTAAARPLPPGPRAQFLLGFRTRRFQLRAARSMSRERGRVCVSAGGGAASQRLLHQGVTAQILPIRFLRRLLHTRVPDTSNPLPHVIMPTIEIQQALPVRTAPARERQVALIPAP